MKKSTTKKAPKKASKVVKKHKAKENTSSQSFEPKEVSIIDKAKEIVAKSKSADQTEANEFCRMRQEIAKRIVEYARIREECQITDKARSATIYRLAKPFLEGNFTLAVVGKTSSGKSTFINTLVGDNLFPTGRFQTTSTLAFIEQGDKVKMEVLFCDGHKEIIPDDIQKIKERLKQLVAIPEEYRHLPIYDINILISGGDDIEEILKKKKGIEERTHRQTDESLWKRYVNCHEKKDIAKEVHITCRLSDEYQGWRIIDTPGIGASGGIQEATLKLFAERDNDGNNLIDAIVFLHDGTDNIEDDRTYEFLERIVRGLPETAKKRLFFVLTKASESVFRTYKKETMQLAKELYAKSFNIPEERFTYIDSLLERLNNDVKDKKYYGKLECPSNWDKNEWKLMTDLYPIIIELIKSNNLDPSSTAVKDVVNEWSNFGHFKSILNTFLRDEKAIAYNTICNFIEEDCLGFKQGLENRIKLLEGKKDLQKAKDELIQEKNKYNDLLNGLRRKATKGFVKPQFAFVDKRIEEFSNKESIGLIRRAFIELQDEVDEREKQIFEELKNEFEGCCSITPDEHVSFGYVDFDEIERQAKELSLVPDEERPEPEIEKKGCCWHDDTIKNTYPHKKEDAELKRREFAALIIMEARKRKREYLTSLEEIINNYCGLIDNEINRKYEEADKLLGEIEKQLEDKNSHISELRSKIEIINGRRQKEE